MGGVSLCLYKHLYLFGSPTHHLSELYPHIVLASIAFLNITLFQILLGPLVSLHILPFLIVFSVRDPKLNGFPPVNPICVVNNSIMTKVIESFQQSTPSCTG
jgi:hypothetical protein